MLGLLAALPLWGVIAFALKALAGGRQDVDTYRLEEVDDVWHRLAEEAWVDREQIALREAHLGHTPSDSTTPLWLGGSVVIYGALVMWVGILVSWPA